LSTPAATLSAREVYRRLFRYARPHWRMLALGTFGMALYASINLAFLWFIQTFFKIADANIASQPIYDYLPFILIGIFLVRGGADYLSNYCPAYVGRQMIRKMRAELFAHYMSLPTSFYERESSGPMLSRLTYNAELVADATTNSATVLIRDSATILVLLCALFYKNWHLAIVALLVAPAMAMLVRSVNQRFRRYATRIQNSMGDVTRVAKEAIDAHRVVKVFNAERHMDALFEAANELNRRSNVRLINARASSNPIVQMILSVGLALVIYFAIRELRGGQIMLADFTTFMVALMMIPEPMRRLVAVSGPLQQSLAAGAGLFEVLDTPAEPSGGAHRLGRARGEVEFRDVNFAYTDEKGPVLRHVSLKVAAGTNVAIVGRSGSGKSTLVSLLPRFYDPLSGAVLIDGVDIRDCPRSDVRAQMSLVSQEVVVFNESVRNNILFGLEGVEEARLAQVLEASYVQEFVAELPQGLETMLGDRGTLLSGGQRQRIAIARALLRDTPILILDEATSALDTASERHIQTALERLVKNRTTFVIAHRLSTIEHADLILVMQEGAIVESGTHAQLLARGAVYAQLHALQFNI
jgi:ATP-binding cassette, subfamily B, bacterial MsbA